MNTKQEEELKKFHAKLESEIASLYFGTISINIMIIDGVPVYSSLKISNQKRLKYDKTST